MRSKLLNLTYCVELQPGEKLALPEWLTERIGAGHWLLTIQPVNPGPIRNHNAFLAGYAPEDEGLYDDPTG